MSEGETEAHKWTHLPVIDTAIHLKTADKNTQKKKEIFLKTHFLLLWLCEGMSFQNHP
jgi:hypothetical protein